MSSPLPGQPRCSPSLRRLSLYGLCAFVLAIALLGLGLWFTTPLPDLEHLRARAALGNTRVLDRNGALLFEQPDPLSGRQHPVALDAIAPTLQQATVAIEDASFYQNSGLDLRGILRAAWSNLRSGSIVAGGSTITQQLARTFLLDPDLARQQSFERKLREAVLALKLTTSLSKDEILALYLNQVYYGELSYGVEAAARTYFGKPARDLDLAEAAMLAGLPQAPAHYDPFTHPADAAARQSQVIDAMTRAGFISSTEAERAKAEPLQFAGESTAPRAPHFVGYVLDSLAAQLGPEIVLRGGITITTTLDAGLQDAAQSTLRRQIDHLADPGDGGPGNNVSGGAVLVLDPRDGAILTMVGSPNFTDHAAQGQVNAVLAPRQPGSAIKPLTYAAALERGWTPATMILDVPSSFPTQAGRPYRPENYDRTFHGPLSLREALATSSNVAAVRTLDHIGVPALLEMAARLGISSLSQDSGRYGLSLTLGSGEVSLLELSSTYAAFANGGSRIAPYAIVAVAGPDGQALAPGPLGKQPTAPALDPQVAYLISDILSDPYARMRAFGAGGPLEIDRPAAVKTGTTSDWRDNWTIGYTSDRLVGVWVGNPNGQPMKGVSGITGAAPVWHDVMLAAHHSLAPRPFARPAGIVELAVCADSGLLPAPACPATRLERFAAGTAPRQADNIHIAVQVDRALGCRAPSGYPNDRIVTRIYTILPSEAGPWAVANGVPEPPQQMCDPVASMALPSRPPLPQGERESPQMETGGQSAPALISPGPGAVFRISAGVPVERQQIKIEARAGATTTRLTIYIDDEAIKSFSGPPYSAFWQLRPGTHRARIETVDAEGNTRQSEEIVFMVTE